MKPAVRPSTSKSSWFFLAAAPAELPDQRGRLGLLPAFLPNQLERTHVVCLQELLESSAKRLARRAVKKRAESTTTGGGVDGHGSSRDVKDLIGSSLGE